MQNKIAIVTASTKGIGLAITLKLANAGAKVYMAARNEQLVQEVKQQNPGLKLEYVYFDANDQKSAHDMVKKVFEKEKRIDVLINNFGISDPKQDKTIFDTEYDYFMFLLNINISSVFIPCQEVLKVMKQQKSGSIINISTIGSITPDVARISYVTSKSAINTLTQNIALQAGEFNIRCNAILPGLIDTPAVQNNLPEEFKNIFIKSTPLARVGVADDIANAALFLASDDASYITGELLEVAGGFGKTTPIFPIFNMNKK